MRLNKKIDLSRWNRAGLSEFRYLDGNAIIFLETLRQQLAEEFQQDGEVQWKELIERFPELANESRLQNRKRLAAQYYDQRRDYAWEILRSFSRSTHILGEYINAYANEGYISTALEWDNLRKLTAMLDYRPSPPASAETTIALIFKENSTGVVDKGFAVKNKPAAGQSTVIFETMEKLEGSSLVNALHLHDWDKNISLPYLVLSENKVRFFLPEPSEDINIGEMGVLAGEHSACSVRVTAVNMNEDVDSYLDLEVLSQNGLINEPAHSVTLYLQADFVSSPLANGENSALVFEEVSTAEQEIVFIKSNGQWAAQRVLRNAQKHIEFQIALRDQDVNGAIFRARLLKKQHIPKLDANNDVFVLPVEFAADPEFFVDSELNVKDAVFEGKPLDGVNFRYEPSITAGDLYYPDQSSAGSIKQIRLTEISFPGKAPDIKTGSWALVESGTTVEAYKISNIRTDEAWYTVNLSGLSGTVSQLRGAFKRALKAKDFNENTLHAWCDESSAVQTVLPLDDLSATDSLPLGQKLIISSKQRSFVVKLKDKALSPDGISLLYLSPPFHLDPSAVGFTRNNTIIHGNAVKAAHGETQPVKIVGSGDASKSKQCFELSSESISWISDAAFSTGVRADLNLFVGQRSWLQVERLSLAAPEDSHYQVKVNEDNKLSVCFGDGKHGRRLPSGIDNIRVIYRDGYGEEGNLVAGALHKILRPHPLIEAFSAPLNSGGGADKETSESLRENAPATVLTLDRAVSIDDYSHLAARHSMLWQARAFEKMPDRPARSLVEVVVVASGGEVFSSGSETAVLIENYLASHGVPGTPLSVISYSPVQIHLQLNIMVNEQAFDKKQVEQAVAEHLQESLKIKNRALGQGLLRSDVTALLEQVEGVENATCTIMDTPYRTMEAAAPLLHRGDDGLIRKVSIKPFQLLFLDVESYPLQILSQPYQI
ncbi:MAG: hypothetical protein ACJAZP_001372 [Psychromonas sp.]|jgi:hypothetical protein|uniref:baseplate J/gp47 family protein n=1 Tax=Psychromonas sp. TaxID=1884585 RepID=UPI0039E5D8F3